MTTKTTTERKESLEKQIRELVKQKETLLKLGQQKETEVDELDRQMKEKAEEKKALLVASAEGCKIAEKKLSKYDDVLKRRDRLKETVQAIEERIVDIEKAVAKAQRKVGFLEHAILGEEQMPISESLENDLGPEMVQKLSRWIQLETQRYAKRADLDLPFGRSPKQIIADWICANFFHLVGNHLPRPSHKPRLTDISKKFNRLAAKDEAA